jgi:hypothetical protein
VAKGLAGYGVQVTLTGASNRSELVAMALDELVAKGY